MRALLSLSASINSVVELVENFVGGFTDSNVVLEVFLIDLAIFEGFFEDLQSISFDGLLELSGLLNREIILNDGKGSCLLSNMVSCLSSDHEVFVTITFAAISKEVATAFIIFLFTTLWVLWLNRTWLNENLRLLWHWLNKRLNFFGWDDLRFRILWIVDCFVDMVVDGLFDDLLNVEIANVKLILIKLYGLGGGDYESSE